MRKITDHLMRIMLTLTLALQIFLIKTTTVQADVIFDPVEAATGIDTLTLIVIILAILVLMFILLKILSKLRK